MHVCFKKLIDEDEYLRPAEQTKIGCTVFSEFAFFSGRGVKVLRVLRCEATCKQLVILLPRNRAMV